MNKLKNTFKELNKSIEECGKSIKKWNEAFQNSDLVKICNKLNKRMKELIDPENLERIKANWKQNTMSLSSILGSCKNNLRTGVMVGGLALGGLYSSLAPNVFAGEVSFGDAIYLPSSASGAEEILRDLVLGDVDNNGSLDVVAAFDRRNGRITGGGIRWFKNVYGDGNSWEKKVIADESEFADARGVALKDMDGDGDLDVAGVSYGQDHFWWENLGQGNSWAKHRIFPREYGTSCIDLADFDGDGDIDAVACCPSTPDPTRYLGQTAWYENNGTDNWAEHCLSDFPGPHSVFALDMDNDGDMDILTFTDRVHQHPGYEYSIRIYENLGNGQSWEEHVNVVGPVDPSIGNARIQITDIAAADVNGDGYIDVACTTRELYNHNMGWVKWWTHTSSAPFEFTENYVGEGPTIQHSPVDVGDINGDGHLDIACRGFWLEGGGVLGTPWPMYPISGHEPDFIALGDMNGDSNIDFVGGFGGYRSTSILLLKNNPSGLETTTASFDRRQHFTLNNPDSERAVVYTYNFGSGQDNWIEGNGPLSVNIDLSSDWVGAFVYDHDKAKWTEAAYVMSQRW